MIQSMTGYGKADAMYNGKKIHIEIKSLNSKTLDLSLRIPILYREKELYMRKVVSTALERGKIDLNIWIEKADQKLNMPINPASITAYVAQIKTISEDLKLPFPSENIWEVLVKLPDTTQAAVIEILSEEEWQVVEATLMSALSQLQDFRKQEGSALYKKFEEKINNIKAFAAEIAPFEKQRIETIKSRIQERLTEVAVGGDYDKNRFEQELIYYIEKLDINEEKQRLSNHLLYFIKTMQETGLGQGKKLGFIAQEIGREINTTGSKSNQAEMQQIVVKMKDELEQIKEQVLNVL